MKGTLSWQALDNIATKKNFGIKLTMSQTEYWTQRKVVVIDKGGSKTYDGTGRDLSVPYIHKINRSQSVCLENHVTVFQGFSTYQSS